MDNITFSGGKEVRFGTVARTLAGEKDLFAVLSDPLSFSSQHVRIPSGPAILLAGRPVLPEIEELDGERWDGLA